MKFDSFNLKLDSDVYTLIIKTSSVHLKDVPFYSFQDGAPSIFAGFGGFKAVASSTDSATKAGFDFLAKKSSNGSSSATESPSVASFNFSSPAASGSTASGFAFGQSATKSDTSASFSVGNGSSSGLPIYLFHEMANFGCKNVLHEMAII